MSQAEPVELAELLRPLGFYNRRARSLIRFSTEWIAKPWQHPRELYGIGQYAADSWDIFYKRTNFFLFLVLKPYQYENIF